MQFFLRILMFLGLLWGGSIYLTRPRQPYHSAWQVNTNCTAKQACWLNIVPARTSAEQALEHLNAWPEPLLVVVGDSGQSVQWQHPQGYQGYMVFNQSTITFIEIQFPLNSSAANHVYLADIILRYGIPAEIARFPDGTTQLYYYDRWLTVRLDTTTASVLSPHQRVISARLISPYGQGITRPRSLIQGYAWQGFTQLPPIPPWGP